MSQLFSEEVEKKIEDVSLFLLGILTVLFSVGIFVKHSFEVRQHQAKIEQQIKKAASPPPFAELASKEESEAQ